MYLPRAGREYAHFTFSGLVDGVTVAASFDGGTTWVDLAGSTGQTRQALLRGPDYVGDMTASTLVPKSTPVKCRIVASPETIIRDQGVVILV